MPGSPMLYLKGMRILMFQLPGFYCTLKPEVVHQETESPIPPLNKELRLHDGVRWQAPLCSYIWVSKFWFSPGCGKTSGTATSLREGLRM